MLKKLIACCLLSMLILPAAWASNKQIITPTVRLVSMKAIQTAEQRGDELYLSVTVYPSKGKPTHTQIPKHPLYWPSRKIHEVKNIKLWRHLLKPGEAVTIIVSLMEQDTYPWNTDDLIGSVKVKLRNNGGELESTWAMPNRIDSPVRVLTKYGEVEKFVLQSDQAQYEMYFKLKGE
jgi:hypothetical protein